MREPPFAVGEEITDGLIYRRILPDQEYFVDGRPTYRVFRPRVKDRGWLSAYLKGYISAEDARTKHQARNPQKYGLCEINIARAREVTGGRFRVFYRPTSASHAHVGAYGCDNDEEVQVILADIAVVKRAPDLTHQGR